MTDTVKSIHPDNETYRTLAQEYASWLTLTDFDRECPVHIHFAADSKIILDEEGMGAYVTCSLWIPNPNYEDETQ